MKTGKPDNGKKQMYRFAFNLPMEYYENEKRFPQRKEVYEVIKRAIGGELQPSPFRPVVLLNYTFKTCEKLEENNWDIEFAEDYLMSLPLHGPAMSMHGFAINLIIKTYKSFRSLDDYKRETLQKLITICISKKSKMQDESWYYGIDRSFEMTEYDEEQILKEIINPEFDKFYKPLDVAKVTEALLSGKVKIRPPVGTQLDDTTPLPAVIEKPLPTLTVASHQDLLIFRDRTKTELDLWCSYKIDAGELADFTIGKKAKKIAAVEAILRRAGMGEDDLKILPSHFRSIENMIKDVNTFKGAPHTRKHKYKEIEKIIPLLDGTAKEQAIKEYEMGKKESADNKKRKSKSKPKA